MSAFLTALGSAGQSFGEAGELHRQQGIENQELELRKQAAARQEILSKLAQKRAESELVDIGLPAYSEEGVPVRQMWSPSQGKVVQIRGQAGAPSGMEALRDFVSKQDPKYQKELQAVAQSELAVDPNDLKGALKAVLSRAEKLRDQAEAEQKARDAQEATEKRQTKEKLEGYHLEKDRTGRYVYIPNDPSKPAIPSKVFGKVGSDAEDTGQSDPKVDSWAEKLAHNKITLDYLDKIFVGKKGDEMRPKITARAMEMGWNPQGQVSPAAQTVLMRTTPVLNQAQAMIKDIEDLGLKDNNTSGYLFTARLGYAFGHASPEGSLAKDIAGLSLGSVVEAASALQGSSRSIQALRKALVHTPDPWTDSPKLLHEKLTTISKRLQDIIDDARRYGTKSGLENSDNSQKATMPTVEIAPDGKVTIH